MFQWNANLYNHFNKERLQPSIDLVNKLPKGEYKRIIDIGCGTGMSTWALRNKFLKSSIVGVDLSHEMLEKAQELKMDVEWIQRDCSKTLVDLGQFDLVFSNAFLQWLPNQEQFLKQTKEILSENGVLAIQVPNWDKMPIKECIDQVAQNFEEFQVPLQLNAHNDTLEGYYDMLVQTYEEVEIWQMNYAHIMDSYDAIIDFIKGAGLRPYFKRLQPDRQKAFVEAIKALLPTIYPMQVDGKILFVFERIMFIAK